MVSYRAYWLLFSIVLLQACAIAPLRLGPQESARIDVPLGSNEYEMIEIQAARVTKPGAEVVLSVGEVVLPPIYFRPFEPGVSPPSDGFASRLWAPDWPIEGRAVLKIVNYGPGDLDLRSAKIRHGDREKIWRATHENAPFPPLGWSDVRDVMEGDYIAGVEDQQAADQITSMKDWGVQQRRRAAFNTIRGLPLSMRLMPPLLEDVEVRACALEAGGAIVAFSRPDPARWRSLGPGWMPPTNEANWLPIGKKRIRGFELKGKSFSISIFLGAPENPGGRDSAAEVRLYRIDSLAPLITSEARDLGPGGQWIEFKFATPQPPGEFLLEMRTLRGAPAWLAWNRESLPVPGSEWPTVVETLNILEAPPESRYDEPAPIAILLDGSVTSVRRVSGLTTEPEEIQPELSSRQFGLRADLFPGQTEIFHLRDYQNP